jgi:hypothetical protein
MKKEKAQRDIAPHRAFFAFQFITLEGWHQLIYYISLLLPLSTTCNEVTGFYQR